MKMNDLYDSQIESRRNRKKPVYVKGAKVAPVKVVNHYEHFTVDASIEADIMVPPALFTAMSLWFHEGAGKEITGYGVVTPDGNLVWTTYTDTGTAGFVTNSGDGAVQAMLAAMKAGHEYINLHWHTHPDMGPFYSTTDMEHHAHRAKSSEVGDDMTYLVFDGTYWLTRRVIVTGPNGQCSYGDGRVYLGESDDPLPNKKYTVKHYGSWSDDEWWSAGKKKKKDKKIESKVLAEDMGYGVCDSCFLDFGDEHDIFLGRVGEICFTCGATISLSDDDIIFAGDSPSVTVLHTKESMLRDEAEEALDDYLDLIEDHQEAAAWRFLRDTSKRECYPVLVKLIEERSALAMDALISSHIRTIESIIQEEVLH